MPTDNKKELVNIINQFIKDNDLVDATLCEEKKIPGMHGGLQVGQAHPIVKQLQTYIAKQVEEEQIKSITKRLKDINHLRQITSAKLNPEQQKWLTRTEKKLKRKLAQLNSKGSSDE